MTRLGGWLQQHDPERSALHRAVRLAVVLPIVLALAMVAGLGPQASVFAAFGTVALLLFAEFPGTVTTRAVAFGVLGVIGGVLIIIGTLASEVGWLAVASTAAVAFVISFSGVVSVAAAGATRALLLAYILPVTVPAGAEEIPSRLLGWGLAFVLAVPAALWLLPPRDHDRMRERAAVACRALAARLRTFAATDQDRVRAEAGAASADTAVAAFQQEFRSAASRPVRFSTGSRSLSQLAGQLAWLRSEAALLPADPAAWLPATRSLLEVSSTVLDAAADGVALGDGGHDVPARSRLEHRLDDLVAVRRAVLDQIPLPAGERDADRVPGSVLHEIVFVTEQAGRTVATALAADARPIWARILGRPAAPTSEVDGTLGAVTLTLSRRATLRSVWLQNSLRTGIGLAVAVLIIEVTHVSHSFWVALGTLSVLRTTAIGTGANALRALVGTSLGFAVGALLVLVVGTSPAALWPLLPVTALLAAFAPTAVSFLAGQAAFTLLVLILFNLIDPVGWSVGVVRVEDVALGCAAGILAGLLLWPRGAATQIRRTLAECYRTAADALLQSTRHAAEPSPGSGAAADRLMADATAAYGRLDDAFRSYLADGGTRPVPVPALTRAANAIGRLRQAARVIAQTPTGAAIRGDRPLDRGLGDRVRVDLVEVGASASSWFHSVAACLDSPGLLPQAVRAPWAEELVLADAQADPGLDPDARRGLWVVALHLDGVIRCEPRLVEVLADLAPPARGVRS